MACFQLSGKGADEMKAFRIGVNAVLMGWNPVGKARHGQGSEGAPEWMDHTVVADSSMVVVVHVVRVDSLAEMGSHVAWFVGSG